MAAGEGASSSGRASEQLPSPPPVAARGRQSAAGWMHLDLRRVGLGGHGFGGVWEWERRRGDEKQAVRVSVRAVARAVFSAALGWLRGAAALARAAAAALALECGRRPLAASRARARAGLWPRVSSSAAPPGRVRVHAPTDAPLLLVF